MTTNIAIFLRNDEGQTLSLDNNLDGASFTLFTRVTDALAFLRTHLGTTAYRVTDDCEVLPEVASTFFANENGVDLTTDLTNLL